MHIYINKFVANIIFITKINYAYCVINFEKTHKHKIN